MASTAIHTEIETIKEGGFHTKSIDMSAHRVSMLSYCVCEIIVIVIFFACFLCTSSFESVHLGLLNLFFAVKILQYNAICIKKSIHLPIHFLSSLYIRATITFFCNLPCRPSKSFGILDCLVCDDGFE